MLNGFLFEREEKNVLKTFVFRTCQQPQQGTLWAASVFAGDIVFHTLSLSDKQPEAIKTGDDGIDVLWYRTTGDFYVNHAGTVSIDEIEPEEFQPNIYVFKR
jgi:hypothetical protein